MTEAQSWAQKAAARMVRTPGETTEGQAVGKPAWARVLADRANGRESDPELMAEAQRTHRRPRTEFEQKLLARLGYDEPPPAA